MASLGQSNDSAPQTAEIHRIDAESVIGLVGSAPNAGALFPDVIPIVNGWVAADGGADHALAANLPVLAVIGDMDSLSDSARLAYSDRLVPVAEQMTTDFDKALRHVDAPLTIAVGVSGGRMDHSLAALTVLARHADRPCIIVGADSIVALCPVQIALRLPVGAPLSLYPLAETTIESSGLKWPTDELRFAPTGMVGTSNEVAAPEVHIAPSGPAVLLILDRAELPELVRAMKAAPRWPSNSEY